MTEGTVLGAVKSWANRTFLKLTGGTVSGDLTIGSGARILLANGTVGDPVITFTADPDTGIYRIGANQFGLVAGGVLVASFSATQVSFNGKTVIGDSIAWNEQTGTSYTLTEADNGKVVRITNAAAITLTAPEEATEDLSDGFRCFIVQGGAGQITVAKEGTDTIESQGGNLKIAAQHASACIIKRSGGEPSAWYLTGDLAA